MFCIFAQLLQKVVAIIILNTEIIVFALDNFNELIQNGNTTSGEPQPLFGNGTESKLCNHKQTVSPSMSTV